MDDGIQYISYHLLADPVRVNCYLLYTPDSKEALVIDPGGEPERIRRELQMHGLKLKYILLTHGHFDHIGGAAKLREETGARICMSPLDAQFITDSRWNAADLVHRSPVPVFPLEIPLKDHDALYLGTQAVRILTTPGHTPGGLSACIPGHLFCGDTILKGEIGRSDLPGADVPQSKESIRKKIFTLPEDTVIHCGHGEETSVAYEKKNNRIVCQE